jgi:integral membrane protein (TIGR00529 family)
MLLLIGVLAVAVLVVMLKFKINIGWTMFVESGFIAVAAGMNFDKVQEALIRGLISQKTIGTIAILFFISMIENVMRKSGMINDIGVNLQHAMKGKLAAAVTMPIVLGMLPSVGGARFSCPMVQEVLKDGVPDIDKAFINYWYRHFWLDSFILYPGVIMVSRLTNIPITTLFATTLIFCLLHFSVGLIWAIPAIYKDKPKQILKDIIKVKSEFNIKVFIKALSPIILIMITYIAISGFTTYAMEISVLVALVYLLITKKYSLAGVKNTVLESFKVNYVIIVMGVMVFTEFLGSSGVMNAAIQAVLLYKIPIVILFIILPFLGGLSTGISFTFVSLAFPILIPLGMGSNVWIVVLSYVVGFAGVMLSPIHICGIMTSEYFKVKFRDVLRRAVIGEIIVLIPVIILLIILMH